MAQPMRPKLSGEIMLPRLTSRILRDLWIWMSLLGLVVGLVFPFVDVAFGARPGEAMNLEIFVLSVLAGQALVAAMYMLVRAVVGNEILALSSGMRFVAEQISAMDQTGIDNGCSLDNCQLTINSSDAFGEVAESFNYLLETVFVSREIERMLAGFGPLLSRNLDLEDLGKVSLDHLVGLLGASAGAFVSFGTGEGEIVASHNLVGLDSSTGGDPIIRRLENLTKTQLLEVSSDLIVDAGLLTVMPRQTIVMPLVYEDVTIAAILLTSTTKFRSDTIKILDLLREPLTLAASNAQTHKMFRHLAAVDPLTGAYNRRFGENRLREGFSRSQRTNESFGLLVLDIDHFKEINDTHGHHVGDRVLKRMANEIKANIQSDDVLVRTGGEEFLILLPGASLTDVINIGERLRVLVRSMAFDGIGRRVTISLGGASFPESGASTSSELVEATDLAMYESKRNGRDRLTMVKQPVAANTDRSRQTAYYERA